MPEIALAGIIMKGFLFSIVALTCFASVGNPVEDLLKSLHTQKGALTLCRKAHTNEHNSCSDRLVASYTELVCTKENIDHYGTSPCHENAMKALGDDAPAAALKSEVEDLSAEAKGSFASALNPFWAIISRC